jgi:hypothetical protein
MNQDAAMAAGTGHVDETSQRRRRWFWAAEALDTGGHEGRSNSDDVDGQIGNDTGDSSTAGNERPEIAQGVFSLYASKTPCNGMSVVAGQRGGVTRCPLVVQAAIDAPRAPTSWIPSAFWERVKPRPASAQQLPRLKPLKTMMNSTLKWMVPSVLKAPQVRSEPPAYQSVQDSTCTEITTWSVLCLYLRRHFILHLREQELYTFFPFFFCGLVHNRVHVWLAWFHSRGIHSRGNPS